MNVDLLIKNIVLGKVIQLIQDESSYEYYLPKYIYEDLENVDEITSFRLKIIVLGKVDEEATFIEINRVSNCKEEIDIHGNLTYTVILKDKDFVQIFLDKNSVDKGNDITLNYVPMTHEYMLKYSYISAIGSDKKFFRVFVTEEEGNLIFHVDKKEYITNDMFLTDIVKVGNECCRFDTISRDIVNLFYINKVRDSIKYHFIDILEFFNNFHGNTFENSDKISRESYKDHIYKSKKRYSIDGKWSDIPDGYSDLEISIYDEKDNLILKDNLLIPKAQLFDIKQIYTNERLNYRKEVDDIINTIITKYCDIIEEFINKVSNLREQYIDEKQKYDNNLKDYSEELENITGYEDPLKALDSILNQLENLKEGIYES